MAKVLLVYYSQTGQLSALAESFARPLQQQPDIQLEYFPLQPQQPYMFPWKFTPFFNIFPETVHLQPAPIKPPEFGAERYDLIIIAYTVWFLSPSQPITAFMQSEQAKMIMQDMPVITLIGCRNMWLMAQEKMKIMLKNAGARLIGNVVKVDQSNDWASFVTTPLWMFTGNKKPYTWLPSAGIAEEDIADISRFGQKLLQTFLENRPLDRTLFYNMQAVRIDEKLMMSEKVGHRSFFLWGKLLMKCGKVSPLLRQLVLYIYVLFLILMIFTVVPLSAMIKWLLHPLLKNKLAQQKRYFSDPSGEE